MRPIRLRVVAAILLIAALAGCAKPLPSEKSAYVGEWTATGISLQITRDGRVAYRHGQGPMVKKISAPLIEFQGDNFVVGVGPMVTTFVVSAPPHQVGALWKMTVDGAELTRTR
jgi:hypothetical protein